MQGVKSFFEDTSKYCIIFSLLSRFLKLPHLLGTEHPILVHFKQLNTVTLMGNHQRFLETSAAKLYCYIELKGYILIS